MSTNFDKRVFQETSQDQPRRLNLCGEQVRRIRQEQGLSLTTLQAMLAEVGMFLHRTNIGRLECGRRAVSDIEFVLLARVLNVPLDQLLWENGPPDKNQLLEVLGTITLPNASRRSRRR